MTGAVIFDVDGTLVDTNDLHAEAWHVALRRFGHDVSYDAVRHQIGKGGDQLLPVFLDDAERQRIGAELEAWRGALFTSEYLPKARAFPEIRALFERLRRDGWRIALASSSKSEELAVYKRIAGIEDLVDVETTRDDVERSKPCPDVIEAAARKLAPMDRDRMLMVGDTPYDAIAAGRAGLRTIGVRCGGFPETELRDAGCLFLYDDPAGILHRYDETPFGPLVEVARQETIASARKLRVDRFKLRHISANGGWAAPSEREVVERGHAVGVIPYDAKRDRVVLVAQFRIGAFAAGRFPIMEEIVAGMIDEGESPEATARRECEEECGCTPNAVIPAVTFQPSAGILSETVRIFCAAVDSEAAGTRGGAAGEGEETRILVLPWARVADRLAAGAYPSATTAIGLHWLALNRERLRREWG